MRLDHDIRSQVSQSYRAGLEVVDSLHILVALSAVAVAVEGIGSVDSLAELEGADILGYNHPAAVDAAAADSKHFVGHVLQPLRRAPHALTNPERYRSAQGSHCAVLGAHNLSLK